MVRDRATMALVVDELANVTTAYSFPECHRSTALCAKSFRKTPQFTRLSEYLNKDNGCYFERCLCKVDRPAPTGPVAWLTVL